MLVIEEGRDYEVADEAQLPYVHLRSLGHGQSGMVEEVRDQHTNKVYARKTMSIPYSKAKKVKSTEVFQNKVKIIRGLGKHRHIVSIFATYVTKRHFGIVLQPVASGGDLERFLSDYCTDTNGPDDPDSDSMAVVLEQGFGCLVAGLAFMHENKVRHKDIKPRNILVHKERMIYTDFGYSFDSTDFSSSTTIGPSSGNTLRYSAPEVLEHEERNSRSDVFSLGCVFFDMLSALTEKHYDDSRNFATIMETCHLQIAEWQIPASVSTVPSVVVAMTALEAFKRPCAPHSMKKILETHGFCCLECESKATDDYISSVPEHESCNLVISKNPTPGAQEMTECILEDVTATPPCQDDDDGNSYHAKIEESSEPPVIFPTITTNSQTRISHVTEQEIAHETPTSSLQDVDDGPRAQNAQEATELNIAQTTPISFSQDLDGSPATMTYGTCSI
jgi:serine/threonine protein kinase